MIECPCPRMFVNYLRAWEGMSSTNSRQTRNSSRSASRTSPHLVVPRLLGFVRERTQPAEGLKAAARGQVLDCVGLQQPEVGVSPPKIGRGISVDHPFQIGEGLWADAR